MDRVERQKVRELKQYQMGIDRYRKECDSRELGDMKAGRGLVKVAADKLIPVITEQVRLLEDGEAHPSQVPLGAHYLLNFEPDAVAYLTARVLTSAAYVDGKLTRTAVRLANLIEETYRFDELMVTEPALGGSMARKAKRWPTASARRKIMRKAAQVAGVAAMGWTEQEKLKLGLYLTEAFITHTGYAELFTEKDGNKTVKVLRMADPVRERVDMRHAQLEAEEPVNLPMVCPPKPWTNPMNGGYLEQFMRKPLVRGVTTRATQDYQDELFNLELDEVYAAVNAVQSTAWRINGRVLDVVSELHVGNGQLAGLPSQFDEPLPERPDVVDKKLSPDKMPEDMKAAFMEWKQRARATYEHNAKLRSKRLSLTTKLVIARELRDEPAIWFPHSVDFRSRVYPMTAELSPQGDDLAKSLLMFAEGKPLGESGAYWLHVHLANCFGVDKVSFDDRVLWVELNRDAILDSARDPLDGHRFWLEADDPWCFLAACFEYAGLIDEGVDYVSHLPIGMDGSCSGIQHFSAMLRDERGGAAVNLTKQDSPADIYSEVLTETKRMLGDAKGENAPLCKVWLKYVDRKIVKRPCMTYAYSVTSVGIRDQIADEMRKRNADQMIPGWENWKAAAVLGPVVEQAIRNVVDRAAEAMDWLKALSAAVIKSENPMAWQTPLGFPVQQPYRKHTSKLVKVWFQGERMRLSLSFETDAEDGKKHKLAVAPNYVHSMDATHLMMVVNRLVAEGVTDSFSMIHDSFGVHACDVDEMQYVIRDEFIKLYSEDWLTKMYQVTLPARVDGEYWEAVPKPPEAGDLDLEEVRDADFFFA